MVENNQKGSSTHASADQRTQDMHFAVMALRAVLWTCLASSPEARVLLAREQPVLGEYFEVRGLDATQAECAAWMRELLK